MLRNPPAHRLIPALFLVAVACGFGGARPALLQRSSIALEPCSVSRIARSALCGTYDVYEDRDAGRGRKIPLNIVVLPAEQPAPAAAPVFHLAGGPGGAATGSARRLARSWMRETRDIVLVDQRGTGRSNPLGCSSPARDDAQAYLQETFASAEHFASCRERLERIADLRLYTTPIAMDDLDEVRQALGYERIILSGGSYGTRAALVYMRRHPETVYAAILNGIAPIAFTNPLFHAREAQNALDATLAECAADADCAAAFPDLEDKFDTLMERLDAEAATATVRHPGTGAIETVRIGREAFADGLRIFMYNMPRARRVPLLIHRAWQGDFDEVAQEMLDSNYGIATALQMGMLLSVTCAEDVARIDPDDIAAATAGTFLGDSRVRRQLAACEVWVEGELPEGYGEPVSVDVPVLLLSGTLDPVTGPRWGVEAASHLPNSLHVVMPGAHGVANGCARDIARRFLATASVEGLDTSCVDDVRLPPFEL